MADQEYLQNIVNSPHVDEGLGDRILSRGSSGFQKFRSMVGGEFSDPNYTKIQSLFNGFLNKITGILKDFSEGPHSVANRILQMKSGITPEQKATVKKLTDLYSLLVPTSFLQHQTQHSILSPRGSRSQLSEMLREGIFSREMSLNAALFSNNPTKIINAYIKELKKVYNNFITDAMKVTGAPRDYVKRVVGNLDQKWSSTLNGVEKIITASSNVLSDPTVPPPNQPSTSTSNPPSGKSTLSPTSQQSLSQKPKAGVPMTVEDDFAVLISNVMDIIVDAVKGDEKLAAAFFKPSKDGGPGYEPLPQSWDEPSVTKEAMEDDKKDKLDKDDEDVPVGEKHEFLYNFHSLYRKQRHFAINIPIHNKVKAKFVNRRTKTESNIEVIWSNSSHENNIFIKYTPVETDKSKPSEKDKGGQILLFKFWDNQVNPRNPDSNRFGIDVILSQANQNSLRLLAGANPEFKKEIQAKTNNLQRAFYATVSRKRMEFKPKPFQLTHDEQGNVFRLKRDGTKVPVSKDELQLHLTSKDLGERERWRNSLEKIGYFKKFPESGSITTSIDEIPNAMDAVKALTTLGHKSLPSLKAIQNAINILGKTASTEEYVKHALGSLTTKPLSSPVSAPVSTNQPKPEAAPSKPGEQELGKASWNEKGIVTWEKPNGKIVKMTPKQLKNMKSPRLELLLKQQGYYDKYPEALKEWMSTGLIDPMDLSNLI
jgi:hypothetical protein